MEYSRYRDWGFREGKPREKPFDAVPILIGEARSR